MTNINEQSLTEKAKEASREGLRDLSKWGFEKLPKVLKAKAENAASNLSERISQKDKTGASFMRKLLDENIVNPLLEGVNEARWQKYLSENNQNNYLIQEASNWRSTEGNINRTFEEFLAEKEEKMLEKYLSKDESIALKQRVRYERLRKNILTKQNVKITAEDIAKIVTYDEDALRTYKKYYARQLQIDEQGQIQNPEQLSVENFYVISKEIEYRDSEKAKKIAAEITESLTDTELEVNHEDKVISGEVNPIFIAFARKIFQEEFDKRKADIFDLPDLEEKFSTTVLHKLAEQFINPALEAPALEDNEIPQGQHQKIFDMVMENLKMGEFQTETMNEIVRQERFLSRVRIEVLGENFTQNGSQDMRYDDQTGEMMRPEMVAVVRNILSGKSLKVILNSSENTSSGKALREEIFGEIFHSHFGSILDQESSSQDGEGQSTIKDSYFSLGKMIMLIEGQASIMVTERPMTPELNNQERIKYYTSYSTKHRLDCDFSNIVSLVEAPDQLFDRTFSREIDLKSLGLDNLSPLIEMEKKFRIEKQGAEARRQWERDHLVLVYSENHTDLYEYDYDETGLSENEVLRLLKMSDAELQSIIDEPKILGLDQLGNKPNHETPAQKAQYGRKRVARGELERRKRPNSNKRAKQREDYFYDTRNPLVEEKLIREIIYTPTEDLLKMHAEYQEEYTKLQQLIVGGFETYGHAEAKVARIKGVMDIISSEIAIRGQSNIDGWQFINSGDEDLAEEHDLPAWVVAKMRIYVDDPANKNKLSDRDELLNETILPHPRKLIESAGKVNFENAHDYLKSLGVENIFSIYKLIDRLTNKEKEF